MNEAGGPAQPLPANPLSGDLGKSGHSAYHEKAVAGQGPFIKPCSRTGTRPATLKESPPPAGPDLPFMRFGIVVFPGSNCDHDAWYAVTANLGHQADLLWHEQRSLNTVDAVILPGGFSFGDYLRCGAIAKFSPIMQSVQQFARSGGLVLGICNGFQILTECGLLPGALVRNQNLKFVCAPVDLQVESTAAPLTQRLRKGQRVTIPIAHGDGCYLADERTLDELEAEGQVLFRYMRNPNGSARNIAGVMNKAHNVMGLMPHPERACDPLMGSTDGRLLLESLVSAYALAV